MLTVTAVPALDSSAKRLQSQESSATAGNGISIGTLVSGRGPLLVFGSLAAAKGCSEVAPNGVREMLVKAWESCKQPTAIADGE
jgi:hypothetical protein